MDDYVTKGHRNRIEYSVPTPNCPIIEVDLEEQCQGQRNFLSEGTRNEWRIVVSASTLRIHFLNVLRKSLYYKAKVFK
jgi:hypothetical protein